MGKFLELSVQDVKELSENLLVKRLPKSTLFHNMTTIFLRTKLLTELMPTRFFAYNGIFSGEGSFIVAKQDMKKYPYSPTTWLLCAPNPKFVTNGMLDALDLLLDWTDQITFTSVHIDISKSLKNLCEKHGSVKEWPNMSAYGMRDDQLLNPSSEIPDPDVSIVALDANGIRQLVKYWEFAEECHFNEVYDTASILGSAGVKVNDELVSWAYAAQDGVIHGLYTLEGHRGKGFGKLVLQELAKILKEKGIRAVTTVEDYNSPSKKLMIKSGFEFLYNMDWIDFKPTIANQ